MKRDLCVRGAHACGVLVSAFCRNDLSCGRQSVCRCPTKVRDWGTPSPARCKRALPRRSCDAFTVIELLIVMAIIIVLAGLVIGASGYVQKKGQRSRAEAEIAAMSAALESYKADNGIYPDTAVVDARTELDADGANRPDYEAASRILYEALSGDANGNRRSESGEGKSYFAFKPTMLSPLDQALNVTAIRDPFANSYGYSTAHQSDPDLGYNPTFDLWSTADSRVPAQWITNW